MTLCARRYLQAPSKWTPSERHRVLLMRCQARGNLDNDFWTSVRKEMTSHVDITPTESKAVFFESPQEEEIKRAERYVLDSWSSSKFQAAGVAIAFIIGILMLLNSPMNS